ncbi:hypothetical protein GE061_009527 [Apolygus lucorum]|uniref:Uncharacterized protein n=1 Tax=Apolygus lucorum TaxID=248454 RepID=A0A6A4KGE5_APOLU|nr:hypothetical protein GE061_009527 [Apolygus lucorum]
MLNLKSKGKRHHGRRSKLRPVVLEYEKFLKVGFLLLMLCVIGIMSKPLLEDKSFFKRAFCYLSNTKCYVLRLVDKFTGGIGQLWEEEKVTKSGSNLTVSFHQTPDVASNDSFMGLRKYE